MRRLLSPISYSHSDSDSIIPNAPGAISANFLSQGETFRGGSPVRQWVATTFAADTPLAVTGLVVKDGIAGNWLWWNMVLSGMMATFLFSRLWRRAEILTDVELTELRYSGKSASLLRGFRALYIRAAD